MDGHHGAVHGKGGGVDREHRRYADPGDEQPGYGGPDGPGRVDADRIEDGGGGDLLARDQVGN